MALVVVVAAVQLLSFAALLFIAGLSKLILIAGQPLRLVSVALVGSLLRHRVSPFIATFTWLALALTEIALSVALVVVNLLYPFGRNAVDWLALVFAMSASAYTVVMGHVMPGRPCGCLGTRRDGRVERYLRALWLCSSSALIVLVRPELTGVIRQQTMMAATGLMAAAVVIVLFRGGLTEVGREVRQQARTCTAACRLWAGVRRLPLASIRFRIEQEVVGPAIPGFFERCPVAVDAWRRRLWTFFVYASSDSSREHFSIVGVHMEPERMRVRAVNFEPDSAQASLLCDLVVSCASRVRLADRARMASALPGETERVASMVGSGFTHGAESI